MLQLHIFMYFVISNRLQFESNLPSKYSIMNIARDSKEKQEKVYPLP